MDLLQIYRDITSILTPLNPFIYRDFIPDKNQNIPVPDFSKGEFGIYFSLDPSDDKKYRQDFNLQIVIVAAKYYKPAAQQKGFDIDAVIDRAISGDFRIAKANAWAYTVDEDDETNVVLQYRLINYK